MDLRRVTADDTASLRREVLRAGRDSPPLGDVAGAVHVAVYDGEQLVATGNVSRQEPGWRIRGMATEPAYRGRGAGGRVLQALLDHVAAEGGGVVWCHARTSARDFYERAGFAVEGDGWDDPDIGPHIRMTQNVDPASGGASSL